MGRVYLASTPAGRAVALKVVRPELSEDQVFRARFRQEIQAARRVHGLYTAQVVDAGPAPTPPWLVTAYVPGPSLQEAVTATARCRRTWPSGWSPGSPKPCRPSTQRASCTGISSRPTCCWAGWPPGDRFRDRPGAGGDLADPQRHDGRLSAVHGARADPGPARHPGDRRVRARLPGGLRGPGPPPVRRGSPPRLSRTGCCTKPRPERMPGTAASPHRALPQETTLRPARARPDPRILPGPHRCDRHCLAGPAVPRHGRHHPGQPDPGRRHPGGRGGRAAGPPCAP